MKIAKVKFLLKNLKRRFDSRKGQQLRVHHGRLLWLSEKDIKWQYVFLIRVKGSWSATF